MSQSYNCGWSSKMKMFEEPKESPSESLSDYLNMISSERLSNRQTASQTPLSHHSANNNSGGATAAALR